MRLIKNQRGDTIVEVLIVIMIISIVLASAYAVVTRGQKTNQQIQEHTQALKLTEGQLENLKAYNDTIANGKFCFLADGTLVASGFGSGSLSSAANDDAFNQYPVGCRRSAESSTCAGSDCRFYIGVIKDGDNYTATTRWDGINRGRDEVKLLYRMPQ